MKAAKFGCRTTVLGPDCAIGIAGCEVVTREEFRKRLLAEDTFVDFDHRLAVVVGKLRDALRDAAEKPTLIETVGRRGYRFVGQLGPIDSLPADSSGGTCGTPSPSSQPAAELAFLPACEFTRQVRSPRRR